MASASIILEIAYLFVLYPSIINPVIKVGGHIHNYKREKERLIFQHAFYPNAALFLCADLTDRLQKTTQKYVRFSQTTPVFPKEILTKLCLRILCVYQRFIVAW